MSEFEQVDAPCAGDDVIDSWDPVASEDETLSAAPLDPEVGADFPSDELLDAPGSDLGVGAEFETDYLLPPSPDLAPPLGDLVDLTDKAPPQERPYETQVGLLPEAPTVYEEGALVSQVPLVEELVTVEDITGSDAYQEWQASSVGGLQPTEGFASPTMTGDSGDPNFWFQQNEQNSCGPASAAQIIGDFLGTPLPDEYDIANRALEKGWYDPNTGMLPDKLAELLTSEGVPSTRVSDQSMDSVEQYLREGRAVVMFVDGRDLVPATSPWALGDEPENSSTDTVNHFVRVVGIDQARGIAIVADPAQPNGAQLEVPLSELEEAWNDVTRTTLDGQAIRDKILIVSTGSDPTPDAGMEAPRPTATTTSDPTYPVPNGDPTRTVDPTSPVPVGDPTRTIDPTYPVPVGDPTRTIDPTYPVPVGDPTTNIPATAPNAATAEVPSPPSADRTSPLVHPEPQVERAVVQREASRPSAPSAPRPMEVALPAPSADTAAPGPADGLVAADSTSVDGLFEIVPGWVLLPVTLAAGRIGMALRRR